MLMRLHGVRLADEYFAADALSELGALGTGRVALYKRPRRVVRTRRHRIT